MPDDRLAHDLYEQDLDAWAMTQAAMLRAAGQALSQDGIRIPELLRSLDWDHLAEEIEGLARRDRRELASRLALIIEHLAKLEFSHAIASRAVWQETILRERAEIEALLDDSPSLNGWLAPCLAQRMPRAIETASRALVLYGESAAAEHLRQSRLAAPYSLDQTLGTWLPDAPPSAL